MFRILFSVCLLSLLLCTFGCRMCRSPYDSCISTYIDRPGDFRGCGPLYRAGSILSSEYNMCQSDYSEVIYVGDSEELYGNAGNYGVTTPISIVETVAPRPVESGTVPREPTRLPTVAIPQKTPTQLPVQQDTVPPAPDNLIPGPYRDSNVPLPSLNELIDSPRRDTMPESMNQVPVTPPGKPKVNTPVFEDTPVETMPFSPNDAVPHETVPQDASPEVPPPLLTLPEGTPPITLEELRRLDPSVQDLQIISIEEAATESSVY